MYCSRRKEEKLIKMINQLLAIEYNRIQFRIQDNDSIKCEYYCITFIEHMLEGKNLLDCSNVFFS